jgi:metallo-beta-lactamase family protein
LEDAVQRLSAIIRATARRGGSVLLPSFAVGRAQALLHSLQKLRAAGEIPPDMPIYLDSPMAIEATALYQRHRKLMRITAQEAASLTDGVTLVTKPQQSERLSRDLHHANYPRVIISASGMATGGRVLHHLKAMAPNPKNHIVFPGFQVAGTRGSTLVSGASEVKIHGQYVAVKAEVSQLEGYSGHADANGVLAWIRAMAPAPRQVFVVHGEPAAADALRMRIQDELGWAVQVPEHLGMVEV